MQGSGRFLHTIKCSLCDNQDRQMGQDQPIKVTVDGQTTILTFLIPTITDTQLISQLSEQIHSVIEHNKPATLVFDLSQVNFFTSQVLGLLLQARSKMQAIGGKIVLRSLSKNLQRVFKVTYLDRFFQFEPADQTAECQNLESNR